MHQIFLSVGAITLLSIATLSMNRGFEVNDSVMHGSKHALIATSLAASLIEEATEKAFDETSVAAMPANTTALSAASKLGPDGEKIGFYDDADDYHGFSRLDTVDVGGVFNRVVFSTRCRVSYVDAAAPKMAAAIPTWFKKISVTVTSPAMTDTVRQELVFSYFRFE